ncbi:MAG: LamG-like jellyroll fold domain-containing protein [Candidatus Liptonbacteria bacterium]|nr:LamG-like jellyroll fold domain-containing protein [Candidatus Liptonbacteria bacterium]
MKKSHYSLFFIHYSNKSGQSLIEILVALAVGTILIIAAVSVIAPALRANTQADKVQVSSALGKELLENIRVFSEADWHNISNLATGSANKYFLVSTRSPFIAATGTEGILADGIASGTVGYWKLDESAGTTAYDFSGNNVTSTFGGSPSSTEGKIGNAFSFTTAGVDNVNLGNPSGIQFDVNTPFSVAFWVKLPTNSSTVGFVRKSTGIHGLGWYVWAWNSTNRLYFNINSSSTNLGINSTMIITDNNWHHAVATYDGTSNRSGMKLYVDGTINATGTASAAIGSMISTTPLTFSAAGGGGAGLLDDIRIYNRALSATEVKTINNAAIYTRYFYLDTVGRDVSDALLSSGGTNDPSTEKATVVYGWLNGPTSTFSMYLTRFRNNVFDQTDWSGGPGQDGPATTTNSSFSTSTKIYHSTTTGSLIINFQ